MASLIRPVTLSRCDLCPLTYASIPSRCFERYTSRTFSRETPSLVERRSKFPNAFTLFAYSF